MGRAGRQVRLESAAGGGGGDSQARNMGGARRASDFRISNCQTYMWAPQSSHDLSENAGSFPGLCPLQTLGVL